MRGKSSAVSEGGGGTVSVSITFNRGSYRDTIFYIDADGQIQQQAVDNTTIFNFNVLKNSALVFCYDYKGNIAFKNPNRYNGSEATNYWEITGNNGAIIRVDLLKIDEDSNIEVVKS